MKWESTEINRRIDGKYFFTCKFRDDDGYLVTVNKEGLDTKYEAETESKKAVANYGLGPLHQIDEKYLVNMVLGMSPMYDHMKHLAEFGQFFASYGRWEWHVHKLKELPKIGLIHIIEVLGNDGT